MKYLAFDIGARRIGVAVTDESGIVARPLLTLAVGHDLFSKIGEIIDIEKPDLAVFGIPRHQSGEESHAAKEILEFARGIHHEYNIEVDFEDESGTSIEAEERLKKSGKNTNEIKELVDAEAACVILESYLKRN